MAPSFVVQGKKPRLVIDLRHGNRHISARPFHYQRVATFLSTLHPDYHLFSWDVADAFCHGLIRPDHRRYFRFIVDVTVYEPAVMP